MTQNRAFALVLSVTVALTVIVALFAAYALGQSHQRAIPLWEQCQSYPAGSDLGPVLEQEHGYNLEFSHKNIAGAPQFIAHSPGCAE